MDTFKRGEIKKLLKGLPSFQKKVLWKVSQIPMGETRSYKWVARKIGLPRNARQVGRALSKNPYPFIIPCHRVVRENGSLGGYIFGTDIKRYLLDLEKRVNSVIIKNTDKCR